MEALLICDLQRDFFQNGALPAEKAGEIVPVINEISGKFELLIASKKWFNKNSAYFDAVPVHCVRGSGGAEFHPDLETGRIRQVFYRGSEDERAVESVFKSDNMDAKRLLKSEDVVRLYICGLTTENSIKATALDSLKAGFDTFIVKDAVRPLSDGVRPMQAIRDMKEAGCHIVESENLK